MITNTFFDPWLLFRTSRWGATSPRCDRCRSRSCAIFMLFNANVICVRIFFTHSSLQPEIQSDNRTVCNCIHISPKLSSASKRESRFKHWERIRAREGRSEVVLKKRKVLKWSETPENYFAHHLLLTRLIRKNIEQTRVIHNSQENLISLRFKNLRLWFRGFLHKRRKSTEDKSGTIVEVSVLQCWFLFIWGIVFPLHMEKYGLQF